MNNPILKSTQFDTPLGSMVAVANEEALYLLEFADQKGLECNMDSLRKKTMLCSGMTPAIASVQAELSDYFQGKLNYFKTPVYLEGSPFQKQVWTELQNIPLGETRSYLNIAKMINKPTAFRAVALANAANPFAIIVPCHRVVNTNGKLGGYAGGLSRKEWLLSHEKKMLLNKK